ncbi:hypothetical protein SD80_012560 [Scytonema tolypothrichoides VB-61278]|nr:hypothetical protein SD80_012560 [Scytonema tolypothrichoides VB-61278]
MPATNNGKAQDLLDRVLSGKPDETKAKVLDLVLRLGINPQDELFIIMIALNHLQVLVEDAPQDWQTLFLDFQGELEEWSTINIETLNSLIRKSEQERILAETSQLLVSALTNSTESWNRLSGTLETSPLLSKSSMLISSIHELSEQLQSIQSAQNKQGQMITRLQHAMTTKSSVKLHLPPWLAILLGVLTISSIYNYLLLNAINGAIAKGG